MRDFVQLSVAPGVFPRLPGLPTRRRKPWFSPGLRAGAGAPGPGSGCPLEAKAVPKVADVTALPASRRPCRGGLDVCGRPHRPARGTQNLGLRRCGRLCTGQGGLASNGVPAPPAALCGYARPAAAAPPRPAPAMPLAGGGRGAAYSRSANCSLRPGTLPIKSRLPSSTPLWRRMA